MHADRLRGSEVAHSLTAHGQGNEFPNDSAVKNLPKQRDLFFVDTAETITDAIYDAIRRFFNLFKF